MNEPECIPAEISDQLRAMSPRERIAHLRSRRWTHDDREVDGEGGSWQLPGLPGHHFTTDAAVVMSLMGSWRRYGR